MKIKLFLLFVILLAFTCTQLCLCQAKDSAMLANSEQWQVKLNKGLFGLSKPDFGPYTTLEVVKLDSAVIKKKTKDSSYAGAEFSGEGTDFDFSKYMTITKKKFYRLSLASASDTVKAIFAIASVSHEKKKTFLGTMLSKNGESTDDVMDYNRNVPGIIKVSNDSTAWIFFLKNFTSGGRQTEASHVPFASVSGGYLKNDKDSIYMQVYSSFSADIVLINSKHEHVAALAFKQKHPAIWIRNDMDSSYQKAIAALFAVFIAIKDY